MSSESTNFIRARIDADRAAGRWGGRVATRFPPEPNGYLHIGHAKSICLNFGLAREYGGTCNLRFDDTNPATEDPEYVESILADVRWLGFEPTLVRYASDYFEQLYAWAEQLVEEGLAYVDDQSLEAIRASRGTVTTPGTPSPWRERSPAENLDLLRRMRAGAFPDGSRVLRAKIDMAHPNMKMRDPLMYRIKHQRHYRTGDAWCIYPMYDWAHGQSDAIEGITHSLCTLEFENNRELYAWFCEVLRFPEPPQQTEFARLNLSYTVMSKRFLKRLVDEGHVEGWDDPRMPTIAGLRRRGVRPEAVRAFAERVGVAKANSTVDLGLLEWAIRDDLNRVAPRRMAVLDPLEIELVGWPAGRVDALVAQDFPPDVDLPGERKVPFGGRLFIERSDFSEAPPPGFRRLVPGGEVRLRYAYVVRCDEVVKDDAGRVVKLRCSVDLDTLGAAPKGRKVPGVIHWVHADTARQATVRQYDRLFAVPDPGARTGDYMDDLHPESLVIRTAWVEPSLASATPGERFQLERNGYVYLAPEDADEGLVLTQIVSLKDRWAERPDAEPAAAAEPEAAPPTPEEQARARAAAREARFAADPDARPAYERLLAEGVGEEDAWTVAGDPRLRALHDEARAVASAASVARWIGNVLVAELRSRDLDAPPFRGADLGALVHMVDEGLLNARLGKQVLGELLDAGGGDPRDIARRRGWIQVSDEAALAAEVDAVLARHDAEVARYRAGERKLVGFFMGQVMQATRGQANPGVVKRLLAERLDG